MRLRKQSWYISFLKPVLLVALLFLIFGIVWLRSSVVSLEYSLSNLEQKRTKLMRERKLLAAEQANLLYIGRLQNVASNGMGLGFPDRVRVVYVNTSPEHDMYRASFHPNKSDGSDKVGGE
jgi:cell division protein FtsL